MQEATGDVKPKRSRRERRAYRAQRHEDVLHLMAVMLYGPTGWPADWGPPPP